MRRRYIMPTYVFGTANGEIVDREYPRDQIPEEIRVNGRKARRRRDLELGDYFVKGTKTPVRRGHSTWPMNPCVASGVQPWQAQELRDFHKKHGISAEVNDDGDPIYTSAKQREKALKARGMFDKASFN
jgi:hypothetical protein